MIDTYTFFKELLQKRSIDEVKKAYPEITEKNIEAFFNQIFDKLNSNSYTLYVDGASSSNPGPAGIGVVLKKGNKVVKTLSKHIGEATNNVAEYTALIEGLKLAKELGLDEIEVLCDSQLVVKQINGEYAVKDKNLQRLYAEVKKLLEMFKHVTVKHISRGYNSMADKLAKTASKDITKT